MMKSAQALLFLFALLCAPMVVRADDADVDESDVVVLTEENFQGVIDDNEVVLVEFYAPWCGHCKRLIPAYAAAATALKETGAVVAKVDATEAKELASQFGVRGYPTLKLFLSGKPTDYNGGRTESDIVSYVKRFMGPAVTDVETAEELDAFKAANDPAVVGFFANSDSEEYALFEKLAKKSRSDYTFARTLNSALFGDVAPNSIALFKSDEETVSTPVSGSIADLTKWLKTESVPLLGELGPDTWPTYRDSGRAIGFLFVNSEDDNEATLSLFRKVAKQFRDDVAIAWIDGVRYGNQAKRLGLSGKVLPSFAIQVANDDTHYSLPEGEITEEALAAFLTAFKNDELVATVRSEPIPEKNDGPVTVVVGDSFEDIVFDDSKDVLVEFYAPWCGHCKRLAPIYDELGEAFADKDSIVIAKIDATENDLPKGISIRGYPTLRFFPAGKGKKPGYAGEEYNGGRTLEDLKEFIEENATTLE